MEAWLHHLFSWLPEGGTYYLLIFFLTLSESLAFVGLIVPGSVLTVFAGFLAANGKGEVAWLMLIASVGSLIGDVASYYLGARFGPVLLNTRALHRHRRLLGRAEVFFASHGGKSVFLGRFVGPLRAFIPFVAGCAQMRPGGFFLFALISCILWGLVYPGLGYLAGASWQLVEAWMGRVSFLFGTLCLLLFLNAWFWKRLFPHLLRLAERIWERLRQFWLRLLQRPPLRTLKRTFPCGWEFLAARFSLKSGAGLYLTVGLLFSAAFTIIFVALLRSLLIGHVLTALDQHVFEAMHHIRHPISDTFFLSVTFLGGVPVVILIGVLVLVWLIINNRDFSALILLGGTAGGELLVLLLKELLQRGRPVPIFPELQVFSGSFPSAHAFIAVVFYGLLVYMLLDTIQDWESRFYLVFAGSFLALLIAFSRIYLGMHWLSDVLGSFALAALWLTFLITASELRRRYGGEFPWRPGATPVRLSRRSRIIILTATTCLCLGGVVGFIVFQVHAILG